MSKAPNALPIHKIVVIGSGGVGKSALTLRYMYDEFNREYDPSKMGHFKKDTQTLTGEECTVEILDTTGEEELAKVRQYYKTGEAFLLVFAIDDMDSLYRVKELYEDVVLTKGDKKFDMLLVGNKSDLEFDRQVLSVEGQSLADRLHCEYLETSAKTGDLVSDAFQVILSEVHERKCRMFSPELKKDKKKLKFKLKAKCCVV